MTNWDYKLEPPTDEAAEYAQARLDDLSLSQTIQEATDLGLLRKPAVIKAIEQALYEYFYEEFYTK